MIRSYLLGTTCRLQKEPRFRISQLKIGPGCTCSMPRKRSICGSGFTVRVMEIFCHCKIAHLVHSANMHSLFLWMVKNIPPFEVIDLIDCTYCPLCCRSIHARRQKFDSMLWL